MTNNEKHTPGPWEIHPCGCGDPVCKDWVLKHPFRLSKADARLSAAAPELLDALDSASEWLAKAVLSGAFTHCAVPKGGAKALKRAMAAIAKARGEGNA